MNEVVVLDTNALIRLFKGTARDLERALMGCARLVVPLAVCGEFLTGLEHGVGTAAERALFDELVAMPNTAIHRPSGKTAQYYAKILNQLRKQGTPIPTNDIWIAAETMELGGTLYSYDRQFGAIPLLDWVLCSEA